MTIILCLRWWYGAGWQWAWQELIVERIKRCFEVFSVGPLIKTWFSPFKQTYSNVDKGSIDVKINALVDNLVSRVIGSLARTVLIFTGVLYSFLVGLSGMVLMLCWPVIPIVPLMSVALMIVGIGA